MSPKEREQEVTKTIQMTALGLAAIGGINPVPFMDAFFIVRGWSGMLWKIAHCYDMPFDKAAFRKMLYQAPVSILAYFLGCGLFLTITQYTGAGTIAAGIANESLNYVFTAALGEIYRSSWQTGHEPASNEVYAALEAAKIRFQNTQNSQDKP